MRWSYRRGSYYHLSLNKYLYDVITDSRLFISFSHLLPHNTDISDVNKGRPSTEKITNCTMCSSKCARKIAAFCHINHRMFSGISAVNIRLHSVFGHYQYSILASQCHCSPWFRPSVHYILPRFGCSCRYYSDFWLSKRSDGIVQKETWVVHSSIRTVHSCGLVAVTFIYKDKYVASNFCNIFYPFWSW